MRKQFKTQLKAIFRLIRFAKSAEAVIQAMIGIPVSNARVQQGEPLMSIIVKYKSGRSRTYRLACNYIRGRCFCGFTYERRIDWAVDKFLFKASILAVIVKEG